MSAKPPRSSSANIWITVAVFAASVIVANGLALLTVYEPILAVPGLVALIAVPAAILWPRLVAYFLVITIFAPGLSVAGLTVGRVTAPIALVALIALLARGAPWLKRSRSTLILIASYVTLAAASLLWTVDVRATVDEIVGLVTSLIFMGVIMLSVRNGRELRALVCVFVAASVVMAIYWIGSYLLDVDRRFNETGDPNFFAALQVIAVPICLALALRMRSARWRWALLLGSAAIAASVVATLSRGGLVTLLVVVLILLMTPAHMLFGSRRRKWTLVATCLLGLGLLLPVAWSDINRRVAVTVQDPDLVGERGDLWRAAITGYVEHPALGVGYGGFRATSFQLLRSTPGVDLIPHLRFVSSGEYVHNAYLGSLAELGPMGLVLFVGILVTAVKGLLRLSRTSDARDRFVPSIATAILIGMASLAMTSMTLSTETNRMLWFMVGMTVILRNLDPTAETREPNEFDRAPVVSPA